MDNKYQDLEPVLIEDFFSNLPAEWNAPDLVDHNQAISESRNKFYVVIDDDAAGTQTVKDIDVLTAWDDQLIELSLQAARRIFILTNSRSLSENHAMEINHAIATKLAVIENTLGKKIVPISRTDSTLRGHFHSEIKAIQDAYASQGVIFDGVCFIPFFLEGGRYTLNDIQWVSQDDFLIPVGNTPYANDLSFSYTNSHLPQWIREQSQGDIDLSNIISIGIDTIRHGGPDAVEKILIDIADGKYVVVNALSYSDLDVFIAAWHRVEETGKRFLFRAAASFVKSVFGLNDTQLINPTTLANLSNSIRGGISVFGSYVPKSTEQLNEVLALDNIQSLEIDVRAILDPMMRHNVIKKATEYTEKALISGQDALLYTSRSLFTDPNIDNLTIGRRVSEGLAEIIRGVETSPTYILAKGGVTASDIAVLSLGIRTAKVAGQVIPGVPVWIPKASNKWNTVPFIVFPGNVGTKNSVSEIIQKFRWA